MIRVILNSMYFFQKCYFFLKKKKNVYSSWELSLIFFDSDKILILTSLSSSSSSSSKYWSNNSSLSSSSSLFKIFSKSTLRRLKISFTEGSIGFERMSIFLSTSGISHAYFKASYDTAFQAFIKCSVMILNLSGPENIYLIGQMILTLISLSQKYVCQEVDILKSRLQAQISIECWVHLPFWLL